jgi:hypothetical protein
VGKQKGWTTGKFDRELNLDAATVSVTTFLWVGIVLKVLWRDKFRAEVLLSILPLLSPKQALDAH